MPLPLHDALAAATTAADRARREVLSRFRRVEVETKGDGSPVTEADRAAEQAIRETLRAGFPDHRILGEEFGVEGEGEGPCWVIDPIDGTIAYSRGIPLFATLIALLEDGEPVVALLDLPALDERYTAVRGEGCLRNGRPTRVSGETDLQQAIVSHGDPFCFERFGRADVFARMATELPLLRGYTDAFGHALVLGGGVGAMVDLDLNPWDAAPSRLLVPEAGGRCEVLPGQPGKCGLVIGSPGLVEQLLAYF
ncbi:MAG: inositol monophosphatase family protein [Myxococcota bacterium]